MHKVIAKEKIVENIFLMRLDAPLIAEERQPGQFIILSVDAEYGERIPLTIADADPGEGSITIIFQVVGKTTALLAQKEPGDSIDAVVGPLGSPTHIDKFGTVVCVGGGIGAAPLYPITQAMREAGNKIISIVGARSKELVILENRMRRLSDEMIVCTDDGSYGRHALVTEPLKEICHRDPKPDLVVAIGPPLMMKFCAETTRPYGVKTMVSLNTIMVDGTGMCGGCRVSVGGETKFVCVDGPEFDGHKVDFDGMISRLQAYCSQEKKAFSALNDSNEHECKLEKAYESKGKKDNAS